jgi:hypothetical protein
MCIRCYEAKRLQITHSVHLQILFHSEMKSRIPKHNIIDILMNIMCVGLD